MKVSAFTIVKNAVILEYPLVESILSILPLVDEYIVLVGKSDDKTLDLVKGIGSEKIRVVENEWKDHRRFGGEIFSDLTNVALAECSGEWAFYLQADEVVHEKDVPRIREALKDESDRPEIKALGVRIRNFCADYWTFDPYAHRKVVRIVRNDGSLTSTGDAVGFCRRDDPDRQLIQYAMPQTVRWLHEVSLFHYRWVKDRRSLTTKVNLMEQHYFGDAGMVVTDYKLDCWYKRFRGEHPRVMSGRIASFQSPFPRYSNRWFKPGFYLHLLKHGYKG